VSGYKAYELNECILPNTGAAYYIGSYEMPTRSDTALTDNNDSGYDKKNYMLIDKRDGYLWTTVMLLAFPIIVFAFSKMYLFVMFGRTKRLNEEG
jgi:hypothetical protein